MNYQVLDVRIDLRYTSGVRLLEHVLAVYLIMSITVGMGFACQLSLPAIGFIAALLLLASLE